MHDDVGHRPEVPFWDAQNTRPARHPLTRRTRICARWRPSRVVIRDRLIPPIRDPLDNDVG